VSGFTRTYTGEEAVVIGYSSKFAQLRQSKPKLYHLFFKNTDKKSLADLSKELKGLVKRAR